jgi:hypothetical protein
MLPSRFQYRTPCRLLTLLFAKFSFFYNLSARTAQATPYSPFVCVTVAAGTCLLSHCIAKTVASCLFRGLCLATSLYATKFDVSGIQYYVTALSILICNYWLHQVNNEKQRTSFACCTAADCSVSTQRVASRILYLSLELHLNCGTPVLYGLK